MSGVVPTLPDGTTLAVEKLLRVCNLIEAEVPGKPDVPAGTIFLTSSEYGAVMRELRSKLGVVPPEAEAFFRQQHFLVGRVTVRHAGTDDAETVMLANQTYEEQSGFRWKRENLRTA